MIDQSCDLSFHGVLHFLFSIGLKPAVPQTGAELATMMRQAMRADSEVEALFFSGRRCVDKPHTA